LEEKINDNIILIGTAHISEESVNEVRKAIETYKPDIVAVELCQRRFDTISKKDNGKIHLSPHLSGPITRILCLHKPSFLLSNEDLGRNTVSNQALK